MKQLKPTGHTPDFAKADAKRRSTAKFVKAVRELAAEQNGMQNLSIRKIAERAGYHNSTIYAYFKDEELLLSLASVRAFADYSKALARLSGERLDAYQSFFSIWRCFCDSAFRKPDSFRLFFFGKYSQNLTSILNQYYDLFPDEKAEYSHVISEMYYGNNFDERCMKILETLVGDPGTRLTDENKSMVNAMTVSVFRGLLEKKCRNSALDSDELTAWFLDSLHYLIDK